jgi:hypothetical protein
MAIRRNESVNQPLNATSSKAGRIITISNRLTPIENESVMLNWFFNKSVKPLNWENLNMATKIEPINLINNTIKKHFHSTLYFSLNVLSGIGFIVINNFISTI